MVTIGTDIEVFLRDKKLAKIVSAAPIIKGGKFDPEPIPGLGDGFAMLHDNVSVEFNVPAADNVDDFVNNISSALSGIIKHLDPAKYMLDIKASHLMDKDELTHPDSLMFGCEPDFNCWNNGEQNQAPCATDTNMRSCGAHIHVGYDSPSEQTNIELAKMMDLRIGVPSVLLDKDNLRRQLYGKSGSFRHKPYGFEYRTLSNFWVSNEELMRWVFTATEDVFYDFLDGQRVNNQLKERVSKAIDRNDKKEAEALIKEFHLKVA